MLRSRPRSASGFLVVVLPGIACWLQYIVWCRRSRRVIWVVGEARHDDTAACCDVTSADAETAAAAAAAADTEQTVASCDDMSWHRWHCWHGLSIDDSCSQQVTILVRYYCSCVVKLLTSSPVCMSHIVDVLMLRLFYQFSTATLCHLASGGCIPQYVLFIICLSVVECCSDVASYYSLMSRHGSVTLFTNHN